MLPNSNQFNSEDEAIKAAKQDAVRDMLSVDGRQHPGRSLTGARMKPHHSQDVYNIGCADCKEDVEAGVHPRKRPKRQ